MTQESCFQATVKKLLNKWLHRECITNNTNTRFMILITIQESPSNSVPQLYEGEAPTQKFSVPTKHVPLWVCRFRSVNSKRHLQGPHTRDCDRVYQGLKHVCWANANFHQPFKQTLARFPCGAFKQPWTYSVCKGFKGLTKHIEEVFVEDHTAISGLLEHHHNPKSSNRTNLSHRTQILLLCCRSSI